MLYLMLVVVFSTLSKKWWFFLLLGWGMANHLLVYSVHQNDNRLPTVHHSLGATNVFQYHTPFTGIPLGFVVIGLGAVHDEYGVRDSQDNLK